MAIDIKDLKGVKSEGVDLGVFEGKTATLTTWEDKQVKSKYGSGVVLNLLTEKITEIETKDGTIIDVKASELFNLKQDEKGEWGFPQKSNSKIQKFMKQQGVKHPSELLGTKVRLRVRTKKQDDGGEKQYLGYVIQS